MDVSRTDVGLAVRLCRVEDEHDAEALSEARHSLAGPLRRAVSRTRHWLLAEQQSDGHWVAELEGDTILESEYILLLAYLGQADSDVAHRASKHILKQQLADGGWSTYPGGPLDVSVSVKAYFALKLVGLHPSEEPLQRARTAIRAAGGADAVNSFTRFYLALLGQISYDECPAVPPELTLLPKWFPVNLYGVSAWSRTIIVPLSIMWATRPTASIEPKRGIRELFLRPPHEWPPLRCPGAATSRRFGWDGFFRGVDKTWKWLERRGLMPLRRQAIARSKRWMIDRFQNSDGLGAIFPPMIWSVIALRALEYADDSPEMKYCRERLEGLFIEDGDSLRIQPCKSPVWDTAITLRALAEAGVEADHPAMRQGMNWLLDRQIEVCGDWSETVAAEPGGWCFEYANDFYPDVDDTAMVSMALCEQFITRPTNDALPRLELVDDVPELESTASQTPRLHQRTIVALERAERWMLAMQNRDGGWGAFDRDNDREFLCHVPFADHNAMIDPSTPDLAARVLESLAALGRRVGHSAVDRAVDYLRRTQEADGSWFGRWGVNYIYGAWQGIVGLRAVDLSVEDPAIVAAAHWLLAYQQPCGAWGESPRSYDDPNSRGQGEPTASQTAWAVMGLMAAGMADHPATLRGVQWLIDTQKTNGSWDEAEFTGTGFPRVFYLRYHLYRIYFPLMALARYAAATNSPDLTASAPQRETHRTFTIR